MFMRFDNKGTFENALNTGINFFFGAGFSVLAKNKHNEILPNGNQLAAELKQVFGVNGELNLSQIATILENTKRADFYGFLRNKFSIKEFDERYNSLQKINIKSIYTTNIDDLILKIYHNCQNKYLTDVSHEGTKINEPGSVDYSALHGCILNDDRKLIFDVSSLNNAYSNSPRIWDYLSHSIEKAPTVFWGYSLNDSGVIQAITSNKTLKVAHKPMWIILTEQSSAASVYYEALGFNIIVSDTNSFLDYLNNFEYSLSKPKPVSADEEIRYFFGNNIVPKNSIGLPVRPISNFFKGNAPIWSDIFSSQIYRTSYFAKAQNEIFSNKNLIILGGPVTGKTTLMMQLAAFTDIKDAYKLVFNSLSEKNAELLINVFRGRKVLVFVDNLGDSVDGFRKLAKASNIILVGLDRGHNYGIISHLLDEKDFAFINITTLSDQDIQSIYDFLPIDQRTAKLNRENNPDYDKDSIFEFISRNVKFASIEVRYADVLKDLQEKDVLLSEFLILSSYVHFARTPLSFDMLYSYFQDDVSSYDDIYSMRDDLKDLIRDYSGDLIEDNDQDYYYPRSIFSAETILRVAKKDILRSVIKRALKNIPSTQIPYYYTYRRYAFDKRLMSRIFVDWEEGRDFYEAAYEYDFQNPYVLQQGALYLSQKKRYTEAFYWIDKAITQTNDRFFSIRNSHAIILFDANINSREDGIEVRSQLDKSMSILERCYRDDKRRIFHVISYAEQTKEYANRYFDEKTKHYIETSIEWLKSEIQINRWNTEIHRLLREISEISI